ncbi:MAG: hypothetical protein AB7F19_02750 [Candidatus Babeliales bacterium]
MKKYYLLCVPLLFTYVITTKAACANDEFGHTFFSVRPEYQSEFPIKNSLLRNRAKVRCEDGVDAAFEVVPYYGQSNKGDNLMKFFGPSAKTELVVDSNPPIAGQTGIDRDINPIHFGIHYTLDGTLNGAPGRYKSTIQFLPERTVFGVGLTYRQYFGRPASTCDKQWYWEFSAPVLHVRNKVNLTEVCDCAVRRGFPAPDSPVNMIEAFSGTHRFLTTNETMNFGLINDTSSEGMKKTGAEIELKLGYDFYNTQQLLFDMYIGLMAPINRIPSGVQLFEAVPGYNRHFGLMFGMGTGVLLWRNDDHMISWIIETNFRYLIKNTQTRSFDLIARPWSRYMIVRNPNGTFSPGINLFTQPMKVQPRGSFDMNIGFVYDTRAGIEFELGYNFYARQAEKVCLVDDFPTGYQTVGFNPVTLRPDTNIITITSNIASNGCPLPAPGQPGFIPGSTITEQDLNLLSASHPAYTANQIYLSLGSIWNMYENPLVVGFGASYEFSGKNTALNRWLVWGKFVISI